MSTSQATGIPRETVRRKLKKLVQDDFIVEKTRGRYVIKPGYMQKPEITEVGVGTIRQTMRFINECVEPGLIKWGDKPELPKS